MIKFLKKILYSLPFGMKAGNDEIMTSKASSNSDNVGVHQVIENENLGEKLLKNEVTQEVEELRYRTYQVEKESEDWEYIGEGIVVKKNKDANQYIKFTQDNDVICEDVLDGLKQVGKYGNVEKYRVKIHNDDFTRFRLEQFIKSVDVDLGGDDLNVKLHFSKYSDKLAPKTRIFINELKNIFDGKIDMFKHEFNNIKNLSFTTYKAVNENNYITYNFYNLTFFQIEENKHEYLMTYYVDYYTRDNIIEKYKSDSMKKKYDNKEKKTLTLDFNKQNRKRYCSRCGREISVYDGDITEHDFGVALCQKCLENY